MSKTYNSKDIDRVLRQHSYLARQLQDSLPGENQYQINTLGTFLRAAYPGGIARHDLYHVMIGTQEPVTLPFLAAVHLTVGNPADAFLARELYVYFSLMAMGLEMSTNRELESSSFPIRGLQPFAGTSAACGRKPGLRDRSGESDGDFVHGESEYQEAGGNEREFEIGKRDAPEGLPWSGAEIEGGFFLRAIHFLQAGEELGCSDRDERGAVAAEDRKQTG